MLIIVIFFFFEKAGSIAASQIQGPWFNLELRLLSLLSFCACSSCVHSSLVSSHFPSKKLPKGGRM